MQNSRNRNLIKYLKYFISIIIGLLIGINLHLFVPITFIPKKIPYSQLLDLLFWIYIGNILSFYIMFYNKEGYFREKNIQNGDSGVIEDEMNVAIKKGLNHEEGKGILRYDGYRLDFKGIRKGTNGNENFSFAIKLGNIQRLTTEIENQTNFLLPGKEEIQGTLILETKDGLEFRFTNKAIKYHNYEISKWNEYISKPDLLKNKINLNKVYKCPFCHTLLKEENTYCPNCFKHKCPICDMWIEKKYSYCPDCGNEFW